MYTFILLTHQKLIRITHALLHTSITSRTIRQTDRQTDRQTYLSNPECRGTDVILSILFWEVLIGPSCAMVSILADAE